MGLRAMVDAQADMVVVGEAASAEDALALFDSSRPDVVLMDLLMPGMGGARGIAALCAQSPEARVIVLTTYDTGEDVFQAIEAGARGYLLKGTFRQGLLETIRCVHAGQRVIPPDVAARLAKRLTEPQLSERELEILRKVAEGKSNKEIGAALFLAEVTIRNRLVQIYAKLGAADRAQATYVAMQRGLIGPRR